MASRATLVTVGAALAIGTAIGYVDSRATWDDAGVTAAAVFLAAAVLGAVRPRAAWLTGPAVGMPILLFNVVLHRNYGSAAAVVIGLIGAGVGALVGKAVSAPRPA